MKNLILIALFGFFINTVIYAQCPAGETEVTVQFVDEGAFPSEIQWDYISGGLVSGIGPFLSTDVVTICVPDGNLIILGCDTFGDGWNGAIYTVTITEDGSVNGCDAQDGCLLYLSTDADAAAVADCADTGAGTPVMPASPTLSVGPCNASPILTDGCTNPIATNYNACAITDDGSCAIPQANDLCANAIPIAVGSLADCAVNTISVNNEFNTLALVPSCDAGAVADAYYTLTVPASGNIQISAPFGSGGSAHAAIYDACSGTELYCNIFVDGSIITGLMAGSTVILQMFQDTAGQFDLCLVEPPPPPLNDLCVDAIRLCGDPIMATNASAFTDPLDPLTTCIGSLENTVWFSFVAASGGAITVDITEDICDSFSPGMQTHILSGVCGGFVEEDCTSDFTTGTTYTLNLPSATPGETYYVYIDGNGGSNCSFEINVLGDFQPCCGPDFSLSPACQLGDADNFYIDVQVNDIGDNPSGYSVNSGAFPNITTAGTVTIGPFPNGTAMVTFEGLDDASCLINRNIDFDCSCDPLSVTAIDDGTICAGEDFELSAVLEEVIPGGFLGTYTVTSNGVGACTATPNGTPTDVFLTDDDFEGPFPLGFNFDFWGNTYTDFYIGSNGYVTFGQGFTDLGEDPIPNNNTPNDIIALFWDDLNPNNGGTISYYDATINGQTCMVVDFQAIEHFGGGGTVTGQIIMCADGSVTINCIDCQADGGTDIATSGIENTDGTLGAFDPALTDGQFTAGGSYMACTTFIPDVAVPSTCDFVYWITDLNNPTGSIVFTENIATVNPTTTTTYYAVVECANEIQCVDEVTVTIDDPVNCGATCEDEIAGQVIAPFDCDLSGITVVISVINADGSETIIGNATTDVNGNYTLMGGTFECGDYSAMLMLPLPACYADAGGNPGPTGPFTFTVDGDGVADGANFIINPEVPTLSQWGLIVLALLLINFGALQLVFNRKRVSSIVK